MKGLGWDDMSRGSPGNFDEIKFYSHLQQVLLEDYQIAYTVLEDAEDFYRELFSGSYDFVTVDLMAYKTGKPEGADIARRVRARMMRERKDLDFPVFLLSSTPEGFAVEDAYQDNIALVAKNLDSAALVAQQITYRLKETGRFARPSEVAIFVRHARVSLAGETFASDPGSTLREIVTAAGATPREVSAETFSLDILDELRQRIQEAERIVVLLTRDEKLGRGARNPSYVTRPNIYVELGMVLGVAGGNRKLILIQEDGAYLPSDVGSHQPFVYRGDLSTIREQLLVALRKPRLP